MVDWGKKISLATFARDMSLPADRLEAFIGGGPLPPDAIRELARVLFHGFATWDELTDRLKPANHQEARPLGGRQTPITDEMMPNFSGGPPGPGPQPVTPPKVEPEKKRAGWVE